MAYEVTATRRRPQKFDELVGQEFVASTLMNSIKTGKIAHAYLFSGPRGCGKTSTARILAKYKVIIVTNDCDHEMIRQMKMMAANSIDEALAMAKEFVGDNATIAVIPDGVSVIVEKQ